MTTTDFHAYALVWYAKKYFSGNRETAQYWIRWYCHHYVYPSVMNKPCIDPEIERFCQSTALAAI